MTPRRLVSPASRPPAAADLSTPPQATALTTAATDRPRLRAPPAGPGAPKLGTPARVPSTPWLLASARRRWRTPRAPPRKTEFEEVEENRAREMRRRMQCAVKKVEHSLVMFGQRTDTAREVEQLGKKIELRRLRDVWRQVDADSSGQLDRGELREVFKLMGKEVTEKDFDNVMKQIDEGGDDEVDFDELPALRYKSL